MVSTATPQEISEMNKNAVAVVERDSPEQQELHENLVECIYNAISDQFGSMGRDVEDSEFLDKVTDVANQAAASLYRFRQDGE